MRKTEINNEIVLLRQTVRQARICVINKSIREAKRLRTSHGNEKQMEKNKNKADKLLKEVFALKRIKDDEISKFGIVKFECLQDVLENPQTDDGTRAMAKVVRYKSLSSRIIEFQEKFPDFKEYVCWRKKKCSSKRRGTCLTDVSEKQSKRLCSDRSSIMKMVCNGSTENADIDITRVADVSREKRRKINGNDEELPKEKELDGESTGNNEGSDGSDGSDGSEGSSVESKNGQDFKTVAKIISNEATVKRFTEILQETREQNDGGKNSKNLGPYEETMELSKKTDDFFLCVNEATLCSSVGSFSKEKNITDSERNYDTFKSSSTRSKKGKPYDGKVKKERRDGKRQKVNSTNVSRYRRIDMKIRDSTDWKENKKRRQAEEKREEGSNTSIVEYENLHPSWVAKKKQQDIMKQGFQGKKIKFDEVV